LEASHDAARPDGPHIIEHGRWQLSTAKNGGTYTAGDDPSPHAEVH